MAQISEPEIPRCEPWPTMELLRKEKEVVGIYLSGHPLDDFKRELELFTKAEVSLLSGDLDASIGRELTLGGVVTENEDKTLLCANFLPAILAFCCRFLRILADLTGSVFMKQVLGLATILPFLGPDEHLKPCLGAPPLVLRSIWLTPSAMAE